MSHRLRLPVSLLVFPLVALVLGFVWQRWHPEGFWRPAEPEAAARPASAAP